MLLTRILKHLKQLKKLLLNKVYHNASLKTAGVFEFLNTPAVFNEPHEYHVTLQFDVNKCIGYDTLSTNKIGGSNTSYALYFLNFKSFYLKTASPLVRSPGSHPNACPGCSVKYLFGWTDNHEPQYCESQPCVSFFQMFPPE